MKTFVGEYDISSPVPHLWGLDGYERVSLLIKRDRQPYQLIGFGHDPARAELSQTEIEKIMSQKLRLHVAVREGLDGHGAALPEPMPPISVVVCTRNRPRSLRRCLQSMTALDYESFEVIVVDNAPATSESADVVASTPFRYVREDRAGLDWARNRGICEAKHAIVAFTDDDVRVDPQWLKGLARGFSDETVQVVTGLILPAELETRAQHLFESYGGMSKGMKPFTYRPGAVGVWTAIQSYRVGVGANMAFRKPLFDRIGEFDTALDTGTPSGGAGDLDIFHRALIGGCPLRYEPLALVWHHHRRDMANLRRQIYYNGRSYGVYLIKRWRERRIGRRALATYVLGKWLPWLVGRLALRLVGRYHLPLSLLWAELWGALHSPWAYWRTYRHDRLVREQSERKHTASSDQRLTASCGRSR
jgi:glycosyltransferase involved in cell wall biosynthesis